MLLVSSADSRTSLCVKGEQAHPVIVPMSQDMELKSTVREITRDDAVCHPVPYCTAQI